VLSKKNIVALHAVALTGILVQALPGEADQFGSRQIIQCLDGEREALSDVIATYRVNPELSRAAD
jgi:hypothetical protein